MAKRLGWFGRKAILHRNAWFSTKNLREGWFHHTLIDEAGGQDRTFAANLLVTLDLGAALSIDRLLAANLLVTADLVAALTVTSGAPQVVDSSDTSTVSTTGDVYPKPNLSRQWWNSYQQRWDGIIRKNDGGGSSQSDSYIVKDIRGSGTARYVVEIEARDTGYEDCFWDDAAKKLHIVSSHGTTTQCWLVDYNDSTDTYTINSNVNAVTITGMPYPTEDGVIPIYKTPNGTLWVARMTTTNLEVARSTDDGQTWSSVTSIKSVSRTGLCDITHFVNGGTTYVLVMASENATTSPNAGLMHALYIDQGASDISSGNWTDDTSNIPALASGNWDDHICAARDADGNTWVVVKTQNANGTDALIALAKRTPGGTWSGWTEVWDENSQRTRPSIVIDDTNSEIYVFSSLTGDGPTILYKKAPLSSPGDLTSASAVTAIEATSKNFNDALVPRENVNSLKDLMVLAHNVTDKTYWYNLISIAGGQDRTFAADLLVTADFGAALTVERPLAANLVATADLSSVLAVDRPLAANLQVTSDLGAFLVADRSLAANLEATADLGAVIQVERPLVASLQVDANLGSTLSIDRLLASSIDVQANLGAAVNVDRYMAANLLVTANLQANVEIGGQKLFAADLQATADLVAALAADRQLAASLNSTADFGTVLTIDRNMVAPFVAETVFGVNVQVERLLAANLLVIADFQASIEIGGQKLFAVDLQATADLGAALATDRRLAASLSSTADFSAVLAINRNMAVPLVAEANLSANVQVERLLVANLLVTMDLGASLSVAGLFKEGVTKGWESESPGDWAAESPGDWAAESLGSWEA